MSVKLPPQMPGLRRRAERLVRKEAYSAQKTLSPDLMQQMIYELRVHQIELEMQNEELRRTQQQLQKSQARYFDLYDLAPIGYFTLNGQGNILEANLTAATMLGVERKTLTRQPLSRYIFPDDQDNYYFHLKQLLKTDARQSCELRMQKTGGELIWVKLESVTAPDKEQGRPFLRVLASDITDIKQVESALLTSEMNVRKLNDELESRVEQRTEELERINRDLEEFCYALSHEFRAPLARLEGFGSIMLESISTHDDEQLTHCARRIIAASRRLRTVIDSLLTLNRLSLKKPHRRNLNLSDMAMQIVSELLENNGERAITIYIAPDLSASGDRHMIEICLRNLLGNAIKYTAKTPEACISFAQTMIEGEKVYFVKDNGAGFDMTYAKNIFVPFCRLHTEAEFEGTGIGLATVHRIIENHHGRIWVEAEPDKGATFYFTMGANGRGRKSAMTPVEQTVSE